MRSKGFSSAVKVLFTALVLTPLVAVPLAVAETDEAAIDYEAHVQPLFNVHCYACHLRGAEPGGLALEPGVSLGELVNVPSEQSDLLRVAPGDPEASYLVHKLRGTQLEVGGSGAPMPLGGSSLGEEAIARIEQWIAGLPPVE